MCLLRKGNQDSARERGVTRPDSRQLDGDIYYIFFNTVVRDGDMAYRCIFFKCCLGMKKGESWVTRPDLRQAQLNGTKNLCSDLSTKTELVPVCICPIIL